MTNTISQAFVFTCFFSNDICNKYIFFKSKRVDGLLKELPWPTLWRQIYQTTNFDFFPNQACNQQLGVWTTVSLNAAQWAAGVHGFLCCHHFLYDIVWKQFSGTHAVLQGDFAFISSHRRKNMFRHHSCQKGWLVLLLDSISDCVACDMVAEFYYFLLTAALWAAGTS